MLIKLSTFLLRIFVTEFTKLEGAKSYAIVTRADVISCIEIKKVLGRIFGVSMTMR